ncbi:hypothetical protein JN87_000244 [Salmonella enterica subsp. enterica]|nr:hypothetical protein [Salmonella enterica subsp. enterica]
MYSNEPGGGIFLDGMEVLGVPKWKRMVMYLAVRLFGRGRYGKKDVIPDSIDDYP